MGFTSLFVKRLICNWIRKIVHRVNAGWGDGCFAGPWRTSPPVCIIVTTPPPVPPGPYYFHEAIFKVFMYQFFFVDDDPLGAIRIKCRIKDPIVVDV